MKLCPQCETGYADSHVTCPTHGVMLGEIRELRPGMLIRNTYRVVRKLGQGGMGAVYLCKHTLMKEQQALKFLSSELSHDEAFTSRFLREVRTLRQIRHKNVVDAGNLEPAEDGTLFFSMEFVDGPDLRDFLRAAPKPFDVQLALDITRGIAEGLGAAHAKGMVHRDIKPENILMARDGDSWVPKIADFGIVATKESSSLYTRTGGSLLTMAYAAPEQWRGVKAADLDGRTDLYALGGVLFEMLTGHTAFEAESYEGWAEQHRNIEPVFPSSLRPELARWIGLDALAKRLLNKDSSLRYNGVSDFISELDAVKLLPQSQYNSAPRINTANEGTRQNGQVAQVPDRRRAPTLEVHTDSKSPRRVLWLFCAALVISAAFLWWSLWVHTDSAVSTPKRPLEPEHSAEPSSPIPQPEKSAGAPGVGHSDGVNLASELSVKDAVTYWVAAFRSKQAPEMASAYAPVVEKYFRKVNWSQAQVEQEIEASFARIERIRTYDLDDIKVDILPSQATSEGAVNYSRATATFHKTWEIDQIDGKTFSGEEIGRLTFASYADGWKIVREEELQIIRASRY